MPQHTWKVHLLPEVDQWFRTLPTEMAERVAAAIDALAGHGPSLSRPLVGHIEGSRHPKMKELIIGLSTRIMFAFDSNREAVLLTGGDKRGEWNRWYRDAIARADDQLDEWEVNLKQRE